MLRSPKLRCLLYACLQVTLKKHLASAMQRLSLMRHLPVALAVSLLVITQAAAQHSGKALLTAQQGHMVQFQALRNQSSTAYRPYTTKATLNRHSQPPHSVAAAGPTGFVICAFASSLCHQAHQQHQAVLRCVASWHGSAQGHADPLRFCVNISRSVSVTTAPHQGIHTC